MSRVVWLTDIHVNFVRDEILEMLLQEIAGERPDLVVISGDIAEAQDVCRFLGQFTKTIPCPIYFVLGNHDFYHGSIPQVRQRVEDFASTSASLTYLTPPQTHFRINAQWGLLGHDGWADGRLGDFARSLVRMMDYRLIDELAGLDKARRWEMLKALADESAANVEEKLIQAVDHYQSILLVTHVPPFREACWYEGQISNDEWAPHFTNKAMGDAILRVMDRFPHTHCTVLCGHTHGSGTAWLRPNLRVLTGGAEYGHPAITQVLNLGHDPVTWGPG